MLGLASETSAASGSGTATVGGGGPRCHCSAGIAAIETVDIVSATQENWGAGWRWPVAHCGVVTAQPPRHPRWAQLCVLIGGCLLLASVGTAVLFGRGLAERNAYLNASACGADPSGDCWVEVSATVAGKHAVERVFTADEQAVQINDVSGPEIVLAGGSHLWSILRPGDRLTLRLWRGDFVHASAVGRSAETTASPLIDPARWYAETLGLSGLGALLLIAGLGWSSRHRGAALVRQRAAAWVIRPALAALCIGIAGMVSGLLTPSASISVVTLVGLAGWSLTELAIQVSRLMRRSAASPAPAVATIPAQATGETQRLKS